MITVIIRPFEPSDSFTTESPRPSFTGWIDWRSTMRPMVWSPPTDVFEQEDKIIVRCEIAGMTETGFNIVFDRGVLTISGVRVDASPRKSFHQMEIRYGEFLTQVEIAVPVAMDCAEAQYINGILEVTLPKAQPHQIHIDRE